MGTVQNRPSRQARRSLSLVLIKRLAHARGVGYDGHTLIEVYRSNFGSPDELARAVRVLSRFAPV